MSIATTNGQELAVRTGTLAIRAGQDMWNDKQRAALSVLGIKNATNADLAVFMHYCQKTQLDPFSRQIYMIERREKVDGQWVPKQTIQVGIDGFRVIRDRIAARLGLEVEYEDTVWYDAEGIGYEVWTRDDPPAACRVVVVRNGKRFPAVVRTAAYAATNRDGELVKQWRTQPEHMIEKCAEAFALRRAFPNDLGGLYIEDELPPAEEFPARAQRVTAADITNAGQGTGKSGTAQSATGALSGSESAKAQEPPAASTEGEQVPGTAGPGAPKFRRLTKTTLGKLKGALFSVPLGNSQEVVEAVSALAGRKVQSVEELSEDEARNVTAEIDRALENAGADRDAAGAVLREVVAGVLAAQRQDDDAEQVPDDGS